MTEIVQQLLVIVQQSHRNLVSRSVEHPWSSQLEFPWVISSCHMGIEGNYEEIELFWESRVSVSEAFQGLQHHSATPRPMESMTMLWQYYRVAHVASKWNEMKWRSTTLRFLSHCCAFFLDTNNGGIRGDPVLAIGIGIGILDNVLSTAASEFWRSISNSKSTAEAIGLLYKEHCH